MNSYIDAVAVSSTNVVHVQHWELKIEAPKPRSVVVYEPG